MPTKTIRAASICRARVNSAPSFSAGALADALAGALAIGVRPSPFIPHAQGHSQE
jgi:hypothetical protein